MTLARTALFLRPSNGVVSTLLQTLGIISYFANRTGQRLKYAHAPREPDAQRYLNFLVMEFDDQREAQNLLSQWTHRVPIDTRTAMEAADLLFHQIPQDRGVGLAEVASLVGLRTAEIFGKTGTISSEKQTMDDEPLSDWIEVKVERSQRPFNRRAKRITPSDQEMDSKLVEAMNQFAGFSGQIKLSRTLRSHD